MEEYPQPTPEEVRAYNKIYPGTPEYRANLRRALFHNCGWKIVTSAALIMAGALMTLAILMIIGKLG